MAATRNLAAGGESRQAAQQAAGTGPDTALSAVRGELEDRPRDPFKGDVMAVCAELEDAWQAYRIGYDGRSWTAEPRAGGATLRALSPDDLIAEMRRETDPPEAST